MIRSRQHRVENSVKKSLTPMKCVSLSSIWSQIQCKEMSIESTMSLLKSRTVPLWIGNEAVFSNVTFPVTNSATGESVTAHGATLEIAQNAIDSSYHAFSTWKRTNPWQRRELLTRAANLLRERREEVAAILRASTTTMSNSPHVHTRF